VSLPQITRFRNRLNHTPLCLLRRHLPRKGGDRVLRKRRLRVDRTRLTPQRFQLYSQNTRQSFPRAQTPCHHSSATVTGWTGNVSVQAGGRPPGACRKVRRDDGGGGAPAGSAGSRISLNGISRGMSRRADRSSQPPDKSLPFVPGQRRPAVRVRVETGLWRAALRMREGIWRSVRRPGVPGSSTQGPARAGRCHPPLIAAHVRAANAARDRLSDVDTIRRNSGPRAICATPHATAKAGHAHQTHFRTAQPARGPPDCPFQNSGVAARGGFSCVAPGRNRITRSGVTA
jgi:hypothetical protein